MQGAVTRLLSGGFLERTFVANGFGFYSFSFIHRFSPLCVFGPAVYSKALPGNTESTRYHVLTARGYPRQYSHLVNCCYEQSRPNLWMGISGTERADKVVHPRAGAPGQWRLLGQISAGLTADHDVIVVRGPYDNFRRLKSR
jgi:hypothetical protein